jgi:hypothetical protein
VENQGTRKGRKPFGKTSKGAKESTSLLRLSLSRNGDDLFASSISHLCQAAFRILSTQGGDR